MTKIFYPSSEKLKYLLASIHAREVALPDFQRDFVWEPRATDELIESICQNFPAGSLLRIRNGKEFYFAPRAFQGAPELNGQATSYLILDGQQRLTSLYQALYGTGEYLYYFNFGGMLKGMDLEDGVFYLRAKVGRRRYGTIEKQAQALVFPLSHLFGDGCDFEEWLDSVLALRTEPADEQVALKKGIRELRKQFLQPMEDYEFPVVTLDDSTSAEAVCMIFETLNRTGVKLSVFDLLAARFWHQEVKLRDLWDQANRDYPVLQEYNIDPYYLLQALSLVSAPKAPSCKRGDILTLQSGQIRDHWDSVVGGLAQFLYILRDDCGVILPHLLPYTTIAIPGAAALATVGCTKGPDQAAVRAKLTRWFWCSVFGQAYENAPNSQAAKDYQELCAWMSEGAPPPASVQDFNFNVEASLPEVTGRQRSLYRGCEVTPIFWTVSK